MDGAAERVGSATSASQLRQPNVSLELASSHVVYSVLA
jgi:hypothetical protein